MAFSPLRRLRTARFNNFHRLSTAVLVGAALLAAGCHPKPVDPKDPKFIVAEKGNWQITRAELDEQINSYLKQSHMTAEQIGPEKMPMLETAMLDNIILKKLILDKAAALQVKDLDKTEAAEFERIKGAGTDEQFQAQLKGAGMTLDELKKRIHEKVLITKVLEAEVFKNTEPTDQEINDIYIKHKDQFVLPAKVRASRILIKVDETTTPADKAAKKKAIDKAHDRVAKGEDFAKVAADVSDDAYSKQKGGDIGFFQAGENESPEFDKVAFSTKVGALSPVFQTSLGYQFLKVTDSKPAGTVSEADAHAFISGKLRQMKMGEAQEAYSKKLLADSGVTYHLTRVEMPSPDAPRPPQGAPPAPAPATNAPAAAPAPEAAKAPAAAAPATNAAPAAK